MKTFFALIISLFILTGCRKANSTDKTSSTPGPGERTEVAKASLKQARAGFKTKLVPGNAEKEPVDVPPPGLFQIVKYDSPAGKLAAYLTPDPKDSKKHPAIIWITGGDCNSIGNVWKKESVENDQSASAYRETGIVMMFPSLRGGNENPGAKEGFLGEVDDVIAAAEYLSKQPYVDPQRIYLGGHSTGGTLVLLVAAATDKFRAAFSFGPVDNVAGYSPEFLPFNTFDPREIDLRSPGKWLHSIQIPVFVFEGTNKGNLLPLINMTRDSNNPMLHFYPVKGASHFSILFPTNRLIAGKILRDSGLTVNLAFTEEELNRPFGK
jgi:dipeptidyl aminopeptidase/acylaminoacyl peptidase